MISDIELAVLYTLAVSSVGVYGILFAGWSANSAYAFLGALRSTAQIISYELLLSSAVLTVVILAGSFNIITIIESQQSIWYVVPLFTIFVIFLVSALAELNRTPFDLPEAESELVSGYNTEHSSIPFVFFFLAEYASIVLISTLTAIFFLGGYAIPEIFFNDTFINISSIVLSLKTSIIAFFIVWVRATLPRVRFDQLLTLCWTMILPSAIALVLLVPSILVAFDAV